MGIIFPQGIQERRRAPLRSMDIIMNRQALCHIPQSNYAFATSADTLCIRLRTAKSDLSAAKLVFGPKFNWDERQRCPMKKILSDEDFDYYECLCTAEDSRLGYYFELYEGEECLCYCEAGLLKEIDQQNSYLQYFQYPCIHPSEVHTLPEWTKSAVFYQIFVERFYSGYPERFSEERAPWNTPPTPDSFFGGDLKGITLKIPYLHSLGINGLYLTPIFESPSCHKYDTTDYRRIDPHFGDEKDFGELVETAHKSGIRIVLDAVFNHAGFAFAPFQDVLKNGEASPYKDWFFIREFPVTTDPPNYRSFAFSPGMPKLNTANPEVRRYLLDTVRYWMETYGIDGWRLDVSDEVDSRFWREFRDVVKSINPDAVLIGENWHNAFTWLQGDQFDSVMNYSLTKSCVAFFAKQTIDAKRFASELSEYWIRYSTQVNHALLNLLDSHDTARFLTLCQEKKARLKNAVAFLFCYAGIPCTYYGSEIGLNGGGEPDCRKTFPWEESGWDHELLGFYRRMIALRKAEPALREGSIRFLPTGLLFVLERVCSQDRILLLINNTPQSLAYTLPDGKNLFTGESCGGTVQIPPEAFLLVKCDA